MTGYTPTTGEVETAFHEFASNLETKYPGTYEEAPEFSDWVQAMYGFRRWYAAEIRKAKAEAWEEGYVLSCQHHGGYVQCNTDNPHKASRANPYTEES